MDSKYLFEEDNFIQFKNLSFFKICGYHKFASSNTPCLEALAGFFRLLMKGIFDPCVLRPFDKKMNFLLLTRVKTCDYTVIWYM